MKFVIKSGMLLLFLFFLLAVIFIQEALSNEHSCSYEKKKFLTEQMIKHKQNRIINNRSPILIGVDALFL